MAKKAPGKIRRGATKVARSKGGRAFGEGIGYAGAFSVGLSHSLETSRASEIGQLNAGMTRNAAKHERKNTVGIHRASETGGAKRAKRRNKHENTAYNVGQVAPFAALLGGAALAAGFSAKGNGHHKVARGARDVSHSAHAAMSIQPGRSRW